MSNLKIEKLVDCINYYDEMPIYLKGDGKPLEDEDLYNLGLTEDDYPFDIKEFKKLKLGFSDVIYECHEDGRTVYYDFDNENKMIVIESEEFTIKECFIVLDIVRKHLELNSGRELFVSFGNEEDETHTLYHGESTAFGMWWKDFHDLFVSRLNDENKLKKIYIETHDYQTDDARFYTKDRVINVSLE